MFDVLAVPGFFSLRIQDGHLYGSLIDILKNGAPTALIALGMTLVIATRGIDLSVGATVAISGALACNWIATSPDPTSGSAAVVGVLLAIGLSLVLGLWNGFLVAVLGIQPIIATLVLMTAGRGLAQLITDGQIITIANPLYAQLGGGFLLGLPVSVVLAAVVFALVALLTRRTALGMLFESVGINPTAARLAGVRARGITVSVYVFVAVCACVAGLMISSNVTAADANNAGLWIELDAILAVVIGGTLLTGGRFSLARHAGRRAGPADADHHRLHRGDPARGHAGVQGPRHHRGLPAAVAEDPRVAEPVPAGRPAAPRRPGRSGSAAADRRTGLPEQGDPAMSLAERTVRPPRIANLTSARVLPVLATFVLFVAMFAVGSIRYDNFFSLQVLLNLFIDNAYLIVLAVGMTFVIITGGIDLSVGSVVALSGVLAAKLLSVGWGPVSVIVAGAARRAWPWGWPWARSSTSSSCSRSSSRWPGCSSPAASATSSASSRSPSAIPCSPPSRRAPFRCRDDAYVSPSVVVALLVVAAGAYLLHSTRFGRTVYAIGGNQQSAVLMGLRVGRTKIAVYAISGLCSAISGLLFAFYSLSGYSLSAVGTELDAIAATVIGGTLLSGGVGLIVGSLLGVLVLGLIQTFISFEGTLSSWWTRIVIGALLLVFVVLQRFLVRRST